MFFHPRHYIAERVGEDADKAWKNGLQIAFISFLLIFLLKWGAFADVRDIKSVVVGEGILTMLEYAVSGGILYGIWRLFGLKKTPREIITPLGFMLGIWILVDGIFLLTQLGIVKLIEPALYEVFVSMQSTGDVSEMLTMGEEQLSKADPELAQAAMNAVTLLSLIGAGIILVWLVAAWPVYKALFYVGYVKLYAVLLVFLILDEFNPIGFVKAFVAALWA